MAPAIAKKNLLNVAMHFTNLKSKKIIMASFCREPMKIPNSDRAIIDPSKLTEYLLNTEHKRGGSKAKLLLYFGYSPENWQQLESDIRKFHLDADVTIVKETAYGVRYEVSANLLTPTNRQLLVKTVWQIDTGTDFPRLITLVPD